MDIKYIKDNEGTNFFPVAHEKGVIDNNGTTLESKIGTLNDAMSSKADKATTYTKAEVNNLIPSADNDIQIVSTLPTTGTANTIYRVPGATSYQDYAWDGSDWVLLGTFSGNVNDGYTYMGVATTSTTPDTSDPNVYYIAGEAGTYTNFNNLQHTGGIGIFKWDGSAWSYDNATIVTDATPTEGSTNPVQSGGVYNAMNNIDSNELKIVDSNGYIIAKIDADGIHSAQSKHSVACMVLAESYYPTSTPTRDAEGNVLHADVMFATGVSGELDATRENGLAILVDVVYGDYNYEITITRDNNGNVNKVEVEKV